MVHFIIFALKIVGISGKINAISTSKIIKIIAIKKNRIEKGIRDELKKLNPHSKGVHFSRKFFLFLETVKFTEIKIKESINIVKIIIVTKIIKK